MRKKLFKAAKTVVETVCAVQKNERVLIVTNPVQDVMLIAQSLYNACIDADAKPVLIIQPVKTLLDSADETVLAALKTEPDVFFSISHNKLGKDPVSILNPIKAQDGKSYDNVFDYNLHGKKCMRAVWTPGITIDSFCRAAVIDYTLLQKRCSDLCAAFENAVSVHISAPAGTNITVQVENRKSHTDDGFFTQKGTGGNIPAGETYISPIVGKTEGIIAFDGSISLKGDDLRITKPIFCKVQNGFVTDIAGAKEAQKLIETISQAESQAEQMEKDGKLPKGQGAIYKKNARNIGELGIGLNPKAKITGNMLEDEKAFKTCHFAIGSNYDDDAPSLIHLDGVVKNPTITVTYKNGTQRVILQNGIYQEN